MNSQTQYNNGQREDFVDKGLNAVEKKFGGAWGQNTQKNRATNEKITDKAREFFEKKTGKKVPHAVSN